MLRALLVAVALCLAHPAGAQALKGVPALSARVVDQTSTLSADQRARLEAKLAACERQQGAQIAVLIVTSVAPETVEQYALRVVEAWQLGRRGVDDGALLLVAKQDRKLRIEVGYGLEGALNDAIAKRIVSETIAPRFKAGDFYGGIDGGVDAIIKVVSGEALPVPKATAAADAGVDLETLVFVGFVLIFVVGGVLHALLGRLLAAGVIGTLAGVIASLLVSSVLLGVLAGLVAFVVSLFAGISGLGGINGLGGGRGGWSSGGSSSGGFSGGGGSFGGGGASGGW